MAGRAVVELPCLVPAGAALSSSEQHLLLNKGSLELRAWYYLVGIWGRAATRHRQTQLCGSEPCASFLGGGFHRHLVGVGERCTCFTSAALVLYG